MKILVLGAGRMGHGAVFDLIHNSPDIEQVTVADFDLAKARAVAVSVGSDRVDARQIDASKYDDIVELFRGHDSVISCVNYWYNVALSKAAISTNSNFCDLGGNNYIVDEQLADRLVGLPGPLHRAHVPVPLRGAHPRPDRAPARRTPATVHRSVAGGRRDGRRRPDHRRQDDARDLAL